MQPPSSFTVTHLHLRKPQADDAAALFAAYTQDPEVTRYLVWRPHTNVGETRAFLEYCVAAWERDAEYTYVITDGQTAELLGMLSLRMSGFTASLGYVLARRAWGRGIMPEAAGAITEWALAQPMIFRVWAICDRENTASARVMEKIGMQREGLMRRGVLHPNISDTPRDCWLYAKVK